MKALSLWQPWAILCVLGLKQYETRSWATGYRGTLAIHAAKRWTSEEISYLKSFIERFGLDDSYGSPLWRLGHDSLMFGSVLGTVQLTAIYRTELLVPKINRQERAFGNYQDGRFAWRLEQPQFFDQPIPVSGKQGLWDWNNVA